MLFRRFPSLAGRIPWTPLGTFPTPVEKLDLPGVRAGATWVKRDGRSGDVYGGNKVRKLEFVLAAAVDAGAERLITAGAIGSHHALATTIYGRRLGLDTTLVLFPQPVTPHVRDVLHLDAAYGADLRFVPRMTLVPAGMLRARLAHRGLRTAVIPPGGSDATGTLGYVDAALELAGQVQAGVAPRPDLVYAAAGTLGTVVGLAIGFTLAGLPTRVVGVRITSRIVVNRLAVRSLARRTIRLLASAGAPAPDAAGVLARVEIRHGRVGRGYGHATDAGRRARTRFADAGLELDPTYTAKAAAELLAAAEHDPGSGSIRLFWHTLSATMPTLRAAPRPHAELPPRIRSLLRQAG